MIDSMEDATARLRAMRDAGVRLSAPVDDDYATLEVDDPEVAARFGFAAVEDESDYDECDGGEASGGLA